MPFELPTSLPPLCEIEHHIDFIPNMNLPNLPHYRLSPLKNKALQEIVDDLLQKQLIQYSHNPCAVSALLVSEKDGK